MSPGGLRFSRIPEFSREAPRAQAPVGPEASPRSSMRRTVRAIRKTTAPPIESTAPIMKRIDQKNPLAGSAPPSSLVAATAAEQLGQANACAGSSQSRANAVVRRVFVLMMVSGAGSGPRPYAPPSAGAK